MVLDDPLPGSPIARRTAWLTVTVLALIAFLVLTAGTTYALLAPGYVFGSGDLFGAAAIPAGSLALVAFGVNRLGSRDRRLRDRTPEFGAWLPARDATNDGDRIDFDAQTTRLRRIALRATALALFWAVLFVVGLVRVNAADRAAADLLVTGVRTDGVVLAVPDPGKGTPTFWVRYHSPDRSWTAEIVRGSGRGYHVGETVTVLYDPADPAHVRTPDEPNVDESVLGSGVPMMLAGLIGWPIAAVAALGWYGRARAVARTGWRIAAVTVVPDPSSGRGRRLPDVRAAFRDGTGIVLRCATSTHRPGAARTDRRAWVGGWGGHMVVLFPYGPRKPGPYLVPVYATGSRTQPISPVR